MKRVRVTLTYPAVSVSKIIDVEETKGGDISAAGKRRIIHEVENSLSKKLSKKMYQTKSRIKVNYENPKPYEPK